MGKEHIANRLSRRQTLRIIGRSAVAAVFSGTAASTGASLVHAAPSPAPVTAPTGERFPLLTYFIQDQDSIDKEYRTVETVAQTFDFIGMHNWAMTAENVAALRRGRVKTVTYYRVPLIVWGWEENWHDYDRHDDWFVRDGHGKRRKEPDGAQFLNPANPGFRAYQIAFMKGYVDRFRLDGVYLDGPAGWPMSDTWHRDVVQFFRELRAALGPSKQIWANSLRSYFAGDPFDWANYVDGYEIETFLTMPWEHKPVYNVNEARAAMKEAQRCLSLGKALVLESGFGPESPRRYHQWQVFEYTAYLMLVGSLPVYWSWGYNKKDMYNFPELHMDLGRPLGPAAQAGDVWSREFSKATVRVDVGNPTSASIVPK